MRIPRDTTIRRIRPQSDPFIACRTEDPVRFETGDLGIVAEVVDPFLFGAFRAADGFLGVGICGSWVGMGYGCGCGGIGMTIGGRWRVDVRMREGGIGDAGGTGGRGRVERERSAGVNEACRR